MLPHDRPPGLPDPLSSLHSSMRRFSIVGTLFIAITLLVGLSWLGLRLIGRSFVADGENSGTIEGLGADATITRDQYGISYIDAASENDAMAALGYAHAQDRLWQMDLMRRAGEGRLSEIFGRTTIKYDELLKTIGFKRTAREIVRAMPRKTRIALDAYCRGVNAFIEGHRGHYPLEFDALGYEPEPWKPEHSVMIVRLLAWELNTSFWTDIVFGELERRVDSLRFSQILPYYPTDAPTIFPGGQRPEPLLEQLKAPPVDTTKRDSTALIDSSARRDTTRRRDTSRRHNTGLFDPRGAVRTRPLPTLGALPDLGEVMDAEREMRRFIGINGAHIGSNAWAIAGNRTTNGKAMLANDPHLPHTAPGRWFQAVLTFSGRHIAGVTLPGLPYVVIGRNDDVAWGLTSLMADETDFYVEHLDSTKHTTMWVDGRAEKLTLLRDTIQVKDSAAMPILIRIGRHGPLISELHPHRMRMSPAGARVDSASYLLHTAVAMRWCGADVSQELSAMQGINAARNVQEFTAAARLGGIPSLNFIYADRNGTIASIPAARIPVREGTHSNYPNPGWESKYDWKGTIAPERLPTLVNPPGGYVASANNKLSNNLGFAMGDPAGGTAPGGEQLQHHGLRADAGRSRLAAHALPARLPAARLPGQQQAGNGGAGGVAAPAALERRHDGRRAGGGDRGAVAADDDRDDVSRRDGSGYLPTLGDDGAAAASIAPLPRDDRQPLVRRHLHAQPRREPRRHSAQGARPRARLAARPIQHVGARLLALRPDAHAHLRAPVRQGREAARHRRHRPVRARRREHHAEQCGVGHEPALQGARWTLDAADRGLRGHDGVPAQRHHLRRERAAAEPVLQESDGTLDEQWVSCARGPYTNRWRCFVGDEALRS